jgi:hypothetical protein
MHSGTIYDGSLAGATQHCPISSRSLTPIGTATCHRPFVCLYLASIAIRVRVTRAVRVSGWLLSGTRGEHVPESWCAEARSKRNEPASYNRLIGCDARCTIGRCQPPFLRPPDAQGLPVFEGLSASACGRISRPWPCTGSAFAGPDHDQFALEFGQTAENGQSNRRASACAPAAKRRPTQTCPPALRGRKVGGYTRSIDTSESVIAIIGCVIAIVIFLVRNGSLPTILVNGFAMLSLSGGLQRALPTDPRVIGGVIGSSG